MPVLVALGSLATTLLGGVAALRIGDRRHLVLGLVAGLMLGVVLFDLPARGPRRAAGASVRRASGPARHASHPTRLTLACTIIGVGFMWLVIGLGQLTMPPTAVN